MSLWGKTRSGILDELRQSFEDFTQWTPAEVVNWARRVARGSQVLTRYLQYNLNALAETTGTQLRDADEAYLTDLGINFASREQLLIAVAELRENEQANVSRRIKAEKLRQALQKTYGGARIIQPTEICSVVKSIFPQTSEPALRALLRSSEPLTFEDLNDLVHKRALTRIMRDLEQIEVIEQKFHELDADQSGELDPEEIRSLVDRCFLESGPTARRRHCNDIIADCDKNNDGTISLDEFLGSNSLSLLLNLPPAGVSKRLNGSDSRCAAKSPRRKEPLAAAVTERGQSKVSFEVHGSHRGVPGEALAEKAEELLDKHLDWKDAETLFTSAAASFTDAQDFRSAGQMWQRVADCRSRLKRLPEAAEALEAAVECFRPDYFEDALNCLRDLSDIARECNLPRKAAQHHREMAEMWEENSEWEHAVDCYRDALRGIDQGLEFPEVRRCLQRILELYVRLRMWTDAVTVTNELATLIQKELPAGAVREHLLADYAMYGVVCRLANCDTANGVLRLDQLQRVREAMDHLLVLHEKGLESILAERAVTAFEKNNEHMLVEALNAYCDAQENVPEDWLLLLFRHVQANLHAHLERISTGEQPLFTQ
eukprot:TRINITY_DN5997_c0_g1_i2.p1 TRINITY_DN5997_c0_g1~~TRINITY_DN5997_c0_g1_i2.p1  ORF type:complete len:601 (-),score=96.99 TRINITY_DN5997_c0_g1_i2:3133-4935(-)